MTNKKRWEVDKAGDIVDSKTGKVVWFKTGMPTEGHPELIVNAQEMADILREIASLPLIGPIGLQFRIIDVLKSIESGGK